MNKPLNETLCLTEQECFAMKPAADRLLQSLSTPGFESNSIIAVETYLDETDHLTNRQKAYGIVKALNILERL